MPQLPSLLVITCLLVWGSIITDTDSHPLHYEDRNAERNEKTHRAPIVIEDNCFIGARSIILKGVTIGEGSVVGVGSVVSKEVPPHSVVCSIVKIMVAIGVFKIREGV